MLVQGWIIRRVICEEPVIREKAEGHSKRDKVICAPRYKGQDTESLGKFSVASKAPDKQASQQEDYYLLRSKDYNASKQSEFIEFIYYTSQREYYVLVYDRRVSDSERTCILR
jgi:hypothetical protein